MGEETITKKVAALEVMQWANKAKLLGLVSIVGGIIAYGGLSIHPLATIGSSIALIMAGGYFYVKARQTVEVLTKKYLV